MTFDYANKIARQLNGPIIDSLLHGAHSLFEGSKSFLEHRLTLSIATATSEELDLIGKFMSIPRPYANIEGSIVLASDELYRLILVNTAVLRKTKSLRELGNMLEYVFNNGAYLLEIQSNGDIKITVDSSYDAYVPYFQQVLDSIFNTLPRLTPIAIQPFSEFIFNHILYGRLLLLRDSDWKTQCDAATHICYINVPAEKINIQNHTLYQTTA